MPRKIWDSRNNKRAFFSSMLVPFNALCEKRFRLLASLFEKRYFCYLRRIYVLAVWIVNFAHTNTSTDLQHLLSRASRSPFICTSGVRSDSLLASIFSFSAELYQFHELFAYTKNYKKAKSKKQKRWKKEKYCVYAKRLAVSNSLLAVWVHPFCRANKAAKQSSEKFRSDLSCLAWVQRGWWETNGRALNKS